MQFQETALPGCWEIHPRVLGDGRGRFVKTYVESEFAVRGLETRFVEEYYTVSRAGVLRGMHFQLPPHQHAKLVSCSQGAVLDVVVDLRRGSPTFHSVWSTLLDAAEAKMLYVPVGCAHGFLAVEDATMQYKVTSVHAPEHDAGVAWDSLGFDWPQAAPLLSDRDHRFPALADFDSPFRFGRSGL